MLNHARSPRSAGLTALHGVAGGPPDLGSTREEEPDGARHGPGEGAGEEEEEEEV